MQNRDDRAGKLPSVRSDHPAMPPEADRVADIAEARVRAERIRRGLEGRTHSDSAALIREDRDRCPER
jgi:hypothetical protein